MIRIAVIVATIFTLNAYAAPAEQWQTHMQNLSATLVNSFPFFYSSTEFRDPKNEKKILKGIEKMNANVHALPAKAGEAWIGAEPLIERAQVDIQKNLKQAGDFFKRKKYEEAQKLVHGSIQRCFACHTAHQVGPQFPAANSEVMAMPTPFLLGKAVVFGALRQFDGALDLIEKSAVSKENAAADDLAKLHMVVSLRAEQNFARAQAYVERLLKESKNTDALKHWLEDIKAWQGGTPAAKNEGDAGFVAHLRESLTLHKQVADKKTTTKAKKETFAKLAAAYKALNFAPLADLADLYAEKAK